MAAEGAKKRRERVLTPVSVNNDLSGRTITTESMTDPRCPVLLTIATLGLLLSIPALGQSHPTIPGNTLESMKGVTDPNAMNEAWQTALMVAAFNSDEKLVKDLIDRKANVNVGSRCGMTALMYARGLPVQGHHRENRFVLGYSAG